jgi:hypothetical protein
MVTTKEGTHMVKQSLLQDILDRRSILADLRSAFEAAKADLARLEDGVIDAIEAGEGHERGPLAAGVDVDAVRRPKWKEVFVATCGEAAAAKVIQATVPTEHKKLVVLERKVAVGGKK